MHDADDVIVIQRTRVGRAVEMELGIVLRQTEEREDVAGDVVRVADAVTDDLIVDACYYCSHNFLLVLAVFL